MGERLAGHVAIVTGGGRGLGRAIAQGYIEAGASVVVTAAQEQSEIEAVVARSGHERALALLADVSDADACARVVTETVRRFGKVDILVNNAGRGMKYVSPRFMSEPTRFWEVDPAIWQMVIATNVNGPFNMARAVTPHMLAQNGGVILNISMNYETMKRRGFSPYGPSKAALESASAIWAQDLAETGIRLHVLLPGGATATGMIPPDVTETARASLLAPSVIVEPAIYLASRAAAHLTGRRIVATEWTPEAPEGKPITAGIGA